MTLTTVSDDILWNLHMVKIYNDSRHITTVLHQCAPKNKTLEQWTQPSPSQQATYKLNNRVWTCQQYYHVCNEQSNQASSTAKVYSCCCKLNFPEVNNLKRDCSTEQEASGKADRKEDVTSESSCFLLEKQHMHVCNT